MDLGQCPRCATPYSASEISGFGVLRGRSAQQGGPRVEYTCPSCGVLIQLIAHGEGRYAPPGEPPPAAVALEERAPPWIRADSASRRAPAGDGPPGPAAMEGPPSADPTPRPPEAPPAIPPPTTPPPTIPPTAPPLGPAEALALLGVEASADQPAIERAFRARSLACHPDKVAHLDEDFVALAEHKFRRLRQAYELLTR